MKDNNYRFDKQLQDRLAAEELPFDPIAWEMMEDKLDKNPAKRPFWFSFRKHLIGGGIMMLLAFAMIYWSVHYNNTSDDAVLIEAAINNKSETYKSISSSKAKASLSHSTSISTEVKEIKLESPIATPSTSILHSAQSVHYGDEAALSSVGDGQRAANKGKGSTLSTDMKNRDAYSGQAISKDVAIYGEDEEQLEVDHINGFQFISSASILPLISERIIDNKMALADIEQQIERPRHQVNIGLGAGYNQLNFAESITQATQVAAISKKEMFLSLSYLYRIRPHLGFEFGAQALVQSFRIANYFGQGEYDLPEPRYAAVSPNAHQWRYELFGNVHFFLPLNQRSELDLYAGYYAMNPLNFAERTWGRGTSFPLNPLNTDTDLMRAELSGRDGPLEGGRIKLGLNYNFLTNKLNTIGIGISYMHEVVNNVDGTLAFFQTSDETKIKGDISTNTSGFKVHLNYGFGLMKAPWKTQIRKDKDTGLYNPWYVGIQYGFKNYILEDQLSRSLIGSSSNQSTGSLYLGHYIKKNLALEFGLGYSQFNFSTRIELPDRFTVRRLGLITIPFALRRDLYNSDVVSLYAKAIVSKDFRIIGLGNFYSTVDEEKVLLNAGLAAGVDVRLFKGMHMGLVTKYNHALRRTAVIQQPVILGGTENEIGLEDLNLRNKFISFGIELKYFLNR